MLRRSNDHRLQINVNAQNSAETIDFTINGVDVDLSTLIANGDVTVISTSNGTLDANGDLVGSDANANANASAGNSTSYQFSMPIDTFEMAHSGGGNGSWVELIVTEVGGVGVASTPSNDTLDGDHQLFGNGGR